MEIMFCVLMFREVRERLESFKVKNITFLLQSFDRKKENVQIFFIYGDKNSNQVKYFQPRRLLEDLCKTHERLMEDFDLGGKPKLFQNLDGNPKFYLNLGGMCRKTSF